MIQLNLLPDVKLAYIKAQKLRSLVISLSVIIAGVSIAILVVLLAANITLKAEIRHSKNTVSTITNQLESRNNIGTVLTVQNQLNSLGSLYAARPAAYRLFDTYLTEVTPEAVSLNNMNVDFTKNTLTLTGTADTLTTVNKYVDTLKLTTYSAGKARTSSLAFSNVVLTSFGINGQSSNPNQAANFTINANFPASIFKSTTAVNLTVPNITITHYQQSDSGSLFKASTNTTSSSATGGQ